MIIAEYPTLRVTVPQAERVLTTVELDGRRLPVLRVAFDTGDIRDRDSGLVSVMVTFYASLELVAEIGTPIIAAVKRVP